MDGERLARLEWGSLKKIRLMNPAEPKLHPTGPALADCWTPPVLTGIEFPGCTPIPMGRSDLDAYEGRLEFWDAEAATAWVAEPPVTAAHERPSQRLAGLAERIAQVRGSPIACLGPVGLVVRDADGAPRRVMQADQSVYLRPLSANLPWDVSMVVGEHDFPDVVVEVDHSTDARRGKLKLYEAWGFPEVWIQVPSAASPSRPKSRLPELTIYLLEGGAYRVSGESRAFPGWTAGEIHAALDEPVPSAGTIAVLERVGAVLGAREGTGPDDDPLLRSQRRQAREQSLAAHRETLRRLAEPKFGNAAASEFARRLEAVTDPAQLANAGERIIVCETADELLDNPTSR